MKPVRYIVFALLFWAAAKVAAQPSAGNRFSMADDGKGCISFELTLTNYATAAAPHGHFALEAEGLNGCTHRTGMPQLPTLSRLIGIAQGNATLEITEDESMVVRMASAGLGEPLAPAQPAWFKSRNAPAWSKDQATYQSGQFYGEPLALVEDLGSLGGKPLARLTLAPFEYNASKGKLRVHTRIAGKIYYSSPYTYSNAEADGRPMRLTVVAPSSFMETLAPFLTWKRQEGYSVEPLVCDSLSRDDLMLELRHRYNQQAMRGSETDYLLLVGDVETIPSCFAQQRPAGIGTHVTDLYYAEYTDDYLPEAIVGRWPVHDTSQLAALVAKTLAYEQGLTADSSLFHQVLLVAGAENQEPAPTAGNGQVNYLKEAFLAFDPSLDTHCYYNPHSADSVQSIIGLIERGMGWTNYSAHCTQWGWLNPTITGATIDSLSSNGSAGIAVNNCCKANAFNGDCFGSHLLNKPNGGAAGVVGAANETLWTEDYLWSVGSRNPMCLNPQYSAQFPGANDRLFHNHGEASDQQARTLGQFLWAGNFAVTQFGSPYDAYYWEIYNLLGDPTLMPFVGSPKPLWLQAGDSLFLGDNTLSLRSIPGARIAILENNTLLGTGIVGPDSTLSLTLIRPIADSIITATATKQYHKPFIDTLAIFRPRQGRALVSAYGLETADGSAVQAMAPYQPYRLWLTLTNIGGLPLTPLQAELVQFPNDSLSGNIVRIFQPLQSADSLLPNESITLYFEISALASNPIGTINLHALTGSNANNYEATALNLDLLLPHPMVKQLQVLQNNRPVTSIEAATDYTIKLTIANQGQLGIDSLSISCASNAQFLSAHDTLLLDLAPNAERIAYFTIHTPDSLAGIALNTDLTWKDLSSTHSSFIIAQRATETFECGAFSAFEWDTLQALPWTIDSSMAHGGRFSARSGLAGDFQESRLSLPIEVLGTDSISFWLRTSSEANCDKLQFCIDGKQKGSWSGEQEWVRAAFPITAGTHTLLWRYSKDDSDFAGSDCAWIDDIILPIARHASAETGYGDIIGPVLGTAGLEKTVIEMFPNPAAGEVTFVLPADKDLEIYVYSALGEIVDNFSSNFRSSIQYSTHNLRLGSYTIVIIGQNAIEVKRLIVVR